MGEVQQLRRLVLYAFATCSVVALFACASASAGASSSHSNCHGFDVNLGSVEGAELNYRFYDVEVHAAPCKAAQNAIAGYLHGRGRHLGGNHGPATELNVYG
jgi:hypothetical protein